MHDHLEKPCINNLDFNRFHLASKSGEGKVNYLKNKSTKVDLIQTNAVFSEKYR